MFISRLKGAVSLVGGLAGGLSTFLYLTAPVPAMPSTAPAQFTCPAQVGRWPLLPEFRSAADGSILRSGELKGGGAAPFKRICYYRSGRPQPIGGLMAGFLNVINFEWVEPGQSTSWSFCNRTNDQPAFHFSSSRNAQASFLVQDNAEREMFRQAGLAVFTSQIEPLAAPCAAPVRPAPPPPGRGPVIFIPGITGSILVSAKDGHFLWPPEYPGMAFPISAVKADFTRLSLNPRIPLEQELAFVDPRTGRREAIYASDVIRKYRGDDYYGDFLDFLQRTGGGGHVEYDVAGNPERRTAAGCNTGQQPTPSLFVFAYDWRLAIEDNARLLVSYVDCVARIHPGKKVNIITHSMGGLIARRFIIDNPNRVSKLITIAAPFLGSAKPLSQMIYGRLDTELSLKGALSIAALGEEVKEMLAYFPGLHQLMLSESYYALGGSPFTVVRNPLSSDPPEPVPYENLMGPGGIVETLFPNPSYNGKTPAQTNRAFHSYSRDGNGQDDWSRDTTGVSYFHLFGVQQSGDTPLSVRQANVRNVLNQPLSVVYGLAPVGPGDGTVPQLSAERISNRLSLNAPNARLFIFNTSDDKLLDHAGIMTNPQVMIKAAELLLGTDFPALTAVTGVGPSSTNVTIRYQGQTFETMHERQTSNGVPIDVYYYRTPVPAGAPALPGEAQWSRFVRMPADGAATPTGVQWFHATWALRGGTWEQATSQGVPFEVVRKLP